MIVNPVVQGGGASLEISTVHVFRGNNRPSSGWTFICVDIHGTVHNREAGTHDYEIYIGSLVYAEPAGATNPVLGAEEIYGNAYRITDKEASFT